MNELINTNNNNWLALGKIIGKNIEEMDLLCKFKRREKDIRDNIVSGKIQQNILIKNNKYWLLIRNNEEFLKNEKALVIIPVYLFKLNIIACNNYKYWLGESWNHCWIVFRSIACCSGYTYSHVLIKLSNLKWTLNNLNKFIRQSSSITNGTYMIFSGIKNPIERMDMPNYLNYNSYWLLSFNKFRFN
ncbi:Cytochrome c [Candidatus Hodgkinia cicadicola]|uniref:Cytochrome c n=1 Tax=Candidatus Hodgkinia cicadicola TaxID=573658 RepID=A0ABX4MJ15_9HYPH|nr:Cytochrome c [Candidatus Hodgkinia cicadicola]